MIECTFAHLPGIRRKGEIRLWQTHITRWENMVAHTTTHPHFTKKVWNRARSAIIPLQTALEERNFTYIANQIPEEYHWRFIPNFWGKILYIDVEMTGLDIFTDKITTIACFDGEEYRYFVQDKDLHEFVPYLENFDAIATFDGERVDLPFLEKQFEIQIDQIHFDLFQLSRRLHFQGGLKQLEERFDLNRNDLQGISGKSAIYLWQRYQESKDPSYLNTLIAYNIADVQFLASLLRIFYNLLKRESLLPSRHLSDETIVVDSPLSPNLEVIQEIAENIDLLD